ncbi:MAG: glycosyl hydrolase family 28 protein [Tepidisphaeraceae bacterium]|jgi:polygalacturonase
MVRVVIVSVAVLFWGLAAYGATAEAPQEEVNPAPPVIPQHDFNLKDFGGVGDGATLNTAAFAKAVDAIKQAGGGRLIVPAGVYFTLPFVLTSHMDLHLEAGATIKAPEKLTDWGLPDPAKATQDQVDDAREEVSPLISAMHATDIAITGGGTIDGSGAIWWIWSDKAARRYPAGRLIYPRPRLVVFRQCQRIHVDGVTLTNSPTFHLATGQCQDVLIENIRIFAPSDAPNTDAIDPSGHRIVIRKCELDIGDDNVAFNGTQGGTEDCIVEDCTCLHGHGISIGSPTAGGVHHVIVRRCTFDGGDNGIRIKSYRGRGGLVDDIRYSDLVMKNVNRAIDINLLYNGNANVKSDVGPRAAPTTGPSERIPEVRDVRIERVKITHAVHAGRILGLPEKKAGDITLSDVTIEADDGLFVQDAANVVLDKVQLDIHVGPPLTTVDAQVTWQH